jgi:hypothetical protein
MRISRERRRQGFVTVLVDIHRSEVSWLIHQGLLAVDGSKDRDQIGRAIERLLQSQTYGQSRIPSKQRTAEDVEEIWSSPPKRPQPPPY